MSGESIITSGDHKRYRAKVTSDGQVKTYSASEPEFAHQSEEHRSAYEFHPASFNIPSSAYIPVFYLKNTASEKNFHIEYIRLGNNGGNTNYNKPMSFRMYAGMSQPDTNVTTGQFGVGLGSHNLYIGAEINPEADVRFFDNTGSPEQAGMQIGGVAMTETQLGNQFNCGPVGIGSTYLYYNGALILPPSETIGIGLKMSAEDGKGICVVAGYFKDVDYR